MRTVAGSGGAVLPPDAPRPDPSTERVWRHATQATDPLDQHDALAVVLELLRAAQHDVATVSDALTLGRRRACEHPSDTALQRGVLFLEQALTFMGVEMREGRRWT